MKIPKLKNALLCRILVYIVVLGILFGSIFIVVKLSFITETIKSILVICIIIAFLAWLIKNFVLLMSMDILLATLHCQLTARKRFFLDSFSIQKTEKSLSRFGKGQQPSSISPRPLSIRYKFSTSLTIFSSGIEKVVASYGVDFLDKTQYNSIISSALANSRTLKGKGKALFLDKEQKKSPLNRVTIIVIYAKRIDEKFREVLFDTVCKNSGDGFDNAVIPCVIDLEDLTCTFDSLRIPYVGFQYPVKNRGIKIIKKHIFNNRLPFSKSPDTLELSEDIDIQQSLWNVWKNMHKEIVQESAKEKKRFENMKHEELIFEDGFIYLKWQDNAIWVAVELDEETKVAEVDAVEFWEYPKKNKIGKETIKELKALINSYFDKLGYSVKYISIE